MVRIVVTGGTGFVGRAVVERVARAGHEVVVFSRASKGARQVGPGTVETVLWTPGAEGPWVDALVDAGAVVNLAGAGLFDERWSPERLAEVRASRVDATRVLAHALAKKSPNATLVSGSAVGIYGMRTDDVVLDEASPHGRDVLTEICEAWEAATEPARDAGLRVAFVRLGIVLGRGGGALEKMLPAFRAFVGGPLGDGKQWMSFVHLDDAVSAIERLISDASLEGPFNVTAPEPVTMNELAQALAHALDRPALFRVPSFAFKLVMGSGRGDALLTGQRVVPRRLMDVGFSFAYPTISAALAQIFR